GPLERPPPRSSSAEPNVARENDRKKNATARPARQSTKPPHRTAKPSMSSANNNPFQDPSVLMASSPAASMALDPNKVTGHPPPPVVSPVHAPAKPAYAPQPPAGQMAPMSPAGQPQLGPPGPARNPGLVDKVMDDLGDKIKATNSTTILRVMRTVNLLLALLTIIAGTLAWVFGRVTSFQKVIAGIYIIMFGGLLLAFEMRSEALDRIIRLNFGFMYGNGTRTVFLLFIAIWPLSMGNFWLTILDAVLLFINAFFNYFVISQHPAFTNGTPPMEVAPQGVPQYQQQGPANV
ncbi:TPA: hypothetical protein N0F65_000432, partial [Lagenidium giganteum]